MSPVVALEAGSPGVAELGCCAALVADVVVDVFAFWSDGEEPIEDEFIVEESGVAGEPPVEDVVLVELVAPSPGVVEGVEVIAPDGPAVPLQLSAISVRLVTCRVEVVPVPLGFVALLGLLSLDEEVLEPDVLELLPEFGMVELAELSSTCPLTSTW